MSQCSVPGCESKHNANGYCMKHYCQMKRHGHVLQRSLKDKNEMIIEGDICRIKLYDLSGAIKAETIVDSSDYPLVKQYKWSLLNNGYVFTRVNGKAIGLSSFILGVCATKQMVVDHMDGDTLNNRRSNLRQCSTQQNIQNQTIRSDNSSGFKGVFWDKGLKKWRARIKVNYVGKHLGCFSKKEDAAIAYNNAAVENFGEYARLNTL
jgi:hypothetical protein